MSSIVNEADSNIEPYIKKSLDRGVKISANQMLQLKEFCKKIANGQLKMEAIKCLCGANNHTLIANEDRYGIPINTVICKNCGLVYSTPYYTKETLEVFYKNYYRSIYTDNAECSELFFMEQIDFGNNILTRLKNFITSNTKKVYEIGCGGGGILKAFQNNGFEVYGCDYGEEYLKYGRQKGLTLENGDYQTLRQYGQVDILILNHILEHIVTPIEFLINIRDLLNNNGLLYIAVPSLETIELWYDSDIYQYLQNAHIYYFSNKYLGNLCKVAGYRLLEPVSEGICICKKIDDFCDLPIDTSEYDKTINLLKDYEAFYQYKNSPNYYSIHNDFNLLNIISYTRYNFKDYSKRELCIFGIKIRWKKYKNNG